MSAVPPFVWSPHGHYGPVKAPRADGPDEHWFVVRRASNGGRGWTVHRIVTVGSAGHRWYTVRRLRWFPTKDKAAGYAVRARDRAQAHFEIIDRRTA